MTKTNKEKQIDLALNKDIVFKASRGITQNLLITLNDIDPSFKVKAKIKGIYQDRGVITTTVGEIINNDVLEYHEYISQVWK